MEKHITVSTSTEWLNLPDHEKRANLIKSYEGQIRYMYKRIGRNERRIARKAKHVKKDPHEDIAWCHQMIDNWTKRINRVKSGEPLENICRKKLTKNG